MPSTNTMALSGVPTAVVNILLETVLVRLPLLSPLPAMPFPIFPTDPPIGAEKVGLPTIWLFRLLPQPDSSNVPPPPMFSAQLGVP